LPASLEPELGSLVTLRWREGDSNPRSRGKQPPIGAAAPLQVFGGLRARAWGCEHFGHKILVDDLVEQPLRFADFRIQLPIGPGLGVNLDQKKLRHYARR
jgi:L-alanine-DL-glutamate epimerase-like enolase superfamily enzyme